MGGGAPIALPWSPGCVTSLTWLGGPKGVRVSSGLRGVLAWEGVIPSLVAGGRVDARGVLASPGVRVVARDALASPGGRAVVWRCTGFLGRSGVCLGRRSSFPGGVFAWEGVIPSLVVGGLAWEGVIPSLGGDLPGNYLDLLGNYLDCVKLSYLC